MALSLTGCASADDEDALLLLLLLRSHLAYTD